jgi:hypothetical protein
MSLAASDSQRRADGGGGGGGGGGGAGEQGLEPWFLGFVMFLFPIQATRDHDRHFLRDHYREKCCENSVILWVTVGV